MRAEELEQLRRTAAEAFERAASERAAAIGLRSLSDRSRRDADPRRRERRWIQRLGGDERPAWRAHAAAAGHARARAGGHASAAGRAGERRAGEDVGVRGGVQPTPERVVAGRCSRPSQRRGQNRVRRHGGCQDGGGGAEGLGGAPGGARRGDEVGHGGGERGRGFWIRKRRLRPRRRRGATPRTSRARARAAEPWQLRRRRRLRPIRRRSRSSRPRGRSRRTASQRAAEEAGTWPRGDAPREQHPRRLRREAASRSRSTKRDIGARGATVRRLWERNPTRSRGAAAFTSRRASARDLPGAPAACRGLARVAEAKLTAKQAEEAPRASAPRWTSAAASWVDARRSRAHRRSARRPPRRDAEAAAEQRRAAAPRRRGSRLRGGDGRERTRWRPCGRPPPARNEAARRSAAARRASGVAQPRTARCARRRRSCARRPRRTKADRVQRSCARRRGGGPLEARWAADTREALFAHPADRGSAAPLRRCS